MGNKSLFKRLLERFIAEDKADQFIDRKYVEETKRVYKLLLVPEERSDFRSPTDRATYDVVMEIIRYMEETRGHIMVKEETK